MPNRKKSPDFEYEESCNQKLQAILDQENPSDELIYDAVTDCVEKHSANVLSQLLTAKKTNLNQRDRICNQTQLAFAARLERVEIMEVLLEHGADPSVSDIDAGGQRTLPIHHLVQGTKSSVYLLKLFKEKGADLSVKVINTKPLPLGKKLRLKDGDTPLHIAANSLKDAFVKELLELNVDLNAVNEDGETVVTSLCRSMIPWDLHLHHKFDKFSNIIQLLLEFGIDLAKECKNNKTAFIWLEESEVIYREQMRAQGLPAYSLYEPFRKGIAANNKKANELSNVLSSYLLDDLVAITKGYLLPPSCLAMPLIAKGNSAKKLKV